MSTKVRNTVYELKRKNPITLGDDSNIEANLKPFKIDSKNSILELSESELKVRGTIDASAITVDGASVQTGTDAGMILGYTDIGLNETHADYTLTTSFVVPTDEFSVAFTIPTSGNVLIELQIQHYFGGSGLGDLYAGLSTANATSGYSALESYHEKRINDGQGRNAVDTINISWTLTGLTAGEDEEIWAGFKVASITGSPTLVWGGDATGRYPDFIMKATALPATITT